MVQWSDSFIGFQPLLYCTQYLGPTVSKGQQVGLMSGHDWTSATGQEEL